MSPTARSSTWAGVTARDARRTATSTGTRATCSRVSSAAFSLLATGLTASELRQERVGRDRQGHRGRRLADLHAERDDDHEFGGGRRLGELGVVLDGLDARLGEQERPEGVREVFQRLVHRAP